MKRNLLALFLFGAFLNTGCNGEDDISDEDAGAVDADGDEDAGSDGLCDDAVEESGDELIVRITDEHNYGFQSTLDVRVTDVAASSDLLFDWSEVTGNLVEQEIDPLADIDMVELMLWNLGEQELFDKLNNDQLLMSDMEAIAMVYTENEITSEHLLNFTSFGNPLSEEEIMGFFDTDLYDPADHSYTIMCAEGEVVGEGTIMLASFRLDQDETNTEISIKSDSTLLEYSADLGSLDRIRVPAQTAGMIIDWSEIEKTAMGNDFVKNDITEAMIAHYGSMTIDDLEEDFLNLEYIADELYMGEVLAGSSIDLSSLESESGDAFTGITPDGIWIVALFCTSCANPAPWFLTILEVCP